MCYLSCPLLPLLHMTLRVLVDIRYNEDDGQPEQKGGLYVDASEPVPGASELEEFFREDPDEAASRIIREAAPFAASAISNLATDDTVAPSVRLNAAKYIIDRRLGPVGGTGEREDALEEFLNDLQDMANGKQPPPRRR